MLGKSILKLNNVSHTGVAEKNLPRRNILP